MGTSLIITDNSIEFYKLKNQNDSNPLFDGPLIYNPPIFPKSKDKTILELAKSQALMDWNRNLHGYKIGNSSVYILNNGNPFESIEELYAFIQKHLLVGLPKEEHQSVLDQCILHLHQGGLLHAAGIAVSQKFLKGSSHPTPFFDFSIELYPLYTGIGIKEKLTLREIYLPDKGRCQSVLESSDLNFNVEHYSTLEHKHGHYGQVTANSLKTRAYISKPLCHMLEVDYIDKPDNTNLNLDVSVFSLFSYLTWPASLILKHFGFLSDINPESIEIEKRWLKTLKGFIDGANETLSEKRTNSRQFKNHQTKTYTMLSEVFSSISKQKHAVRSLGKQFNRFQLTQEKLRGCITSLRVIEHSQEHAKMHIKNLQWTISLLVNELNQIKQYLSTLGEHYPNLTISLKKSLLKAEQEIEQRSMVIKLLKNGGEIDRLLETIDSDQQQINQGKTKLNQHLDKVEGYYQSEIRKANHQDSQIHAEDENTESFQQQLFKLESAFNKLKKHYAKLQTNTDLIEYLEIRRTIIEEFKVFERNYLQSKDKLAKYTENMDLLNNKLDFEQHLEKIAQEVIQTADLFEQLSITQLSRETQLRALSEGYTNPQKLLTYEKLLTSSLEQAVHSAQKEIFQNFRLKCTRMMDNYSDPDGYIFNGWFTAGEWGKQNASRARAFKTKLAKSGSIVEIKVLLSEEYHSAIKEVGNPNGTYCQNLSDLLSEAHKFFSDEVEPEAKNDLSLLTRAII